MLLFHVEVECSQVAGGAAAPITAGLCIAECWVIAEDREAAVATITTALLDQRYAPGVIRGVRHVDAGKVGAGDPARDHVLDAIESGLSISLRSICESPPEPGPYTGP